MRKTLKVEQPVLSGAPVAAKVRDSARLIGLAGLGVYAVAEAEGSRMWEACVAEGKAVEARIRKVAKQTTTEMKAKVSTTQDKLERVFEKRVAHALKGLGVPSRKDLQALSREVEELTAKVQGLTEEAKHGVSKAAA